MRIVALVLAMGGTIGTALVRPGFFVAFAHRPWVWPLPLVALAAPVVALRALARRDDRRAFLASTAFIASLLLATAGVLYPVLLPSTVGSAYDLDVATAASRTTDSQSASRGGWSRARWRCCTSSTSSGGPSAAG